MLNEEILKLNNEEIVEISSEISRKRKIEPALIEKDLWVCITLNYLFLKFKFKDQIAFKGGTSLSKCYNLINRFSEDIDLAFSWETIGIDNKEPYEERTKTQQIKYINKANEKVAEFLKREVLPILQEDFKEMLGDREFSFVIVEEDPCTINFVYPRNFENGSILQEIRIETGVLAESVPTQKRIVRSFIEEEFSELEMKEVEIVVLDSLRTFFEKITILHKEGNRVDNNRPTRYARHYYDVYKLLQDEYIQQNMFNNQELLFQVVDFTSKFYKVNYAKYEDIKIGKLNLIPNEEGVKAFENDLDKMKSMFFGEVLPLKTMLKEIKEFEVTMNRIIQEKIVS